MTIRRYACLPHDPLADGPHSIGTVQDRHIESIRLWRNLQLAVLRQKEPLTEEQQIAYFDHSIWPTLSHAQPSNILLAYQEAGELIGYGGLVHISWPDDRAEVSFLLDPAKAAEPSEYAARFSAFLSLLKQLAFAELRFKRLWTETFASRLHHMSVLEANGFQREGRLRSHGNMAGTRIDSVLHGCLADDR